jgi:TPR repeat protein
VKQNYGEAARWWLNAAEQGYAKAQCSIGCMYYHGQGVKQDYSEAERWYRLAAGQGNADAQSILGVMYNKGEGVKQDYGEAERWFLKAADQGNAVAQSILGELRKQRRAAPPSSPKPAPTATPLSSSRTCANCGVEEAVGSIALKLCSQCKVVGYCGKECQAQHWKVGGHRSACIK